MAKQNQETTLDIGILDNGHVGIQLNQMVKQIVFSPEQAISLGVNLIKAGTRGESVQRMAPPAKTASGPRRVQ